METSCSRRTTGERRSGAWGEALVAGGGQPLTRTGGGTALDGVARGNPDAKRCSRNFAAVPRRPSQMLWRIRNGVGHRNPIFPRVPRRSPGLCVGIRVLRGSRAAISPPELSRTRCAEGGTMEVFVHRVIRGVDAQARGWLTRNLPA